MISSKFNISKDIINFVTIGFLISFTTYSTFSLNNYHLYLDKQCIFLFIYFTNSKLEGLICLLKGIYS